VSRKIFTLRHLVLGKNKKKDEEINEENERDEKI
jgi:hypothetical protein